MTSERFAALLGRMAAAICAGDGDGAAACFTKDGVYHDGFYGEFRSRSDIARMVREFFHRDARDFEWSFHDAVSDGRIGYAGYEFSYVSRIRGAEGRAAGFSGISRCRLDGELIARYDEVFERAPVLAKLGFSDERILKAVKGWAKPS